MGFQNYIYKLCSNLCCCKLPDDEGELANNGWPHSTTSRTNTDNERQPLLHEDQRRLEYGGIRSDRRRTGFSSVFATASTAYENRNHVYLRPPSPRRFGKMRPNTNRTKLKETLRQVKFEFDGDGNHRSVDVKSGCSSGKSAEEKMLAIIVEETAASMIDISGNQMSLSLNRHEARERSKWYAERLDRLSPSLINPSEETRNLINDVGKSFRCFQNINGNNVAAGISTEDRDLMDWAIKEIAEGLAALRVQNGHEFVVPFPSLKLTKENLTPRSDSL